MLFDTHAHLNDNQFSGDLAETIARSRAAGVTRITNVGYDLPSSRRALEIARQYPGCYAAVGIHPHDAQTLTGEAIEALMEMAGDPLVVAIGEIGLDFYRDLSPRETQRHAFQVQIDLAWELQKPIVIHDRDAHGETVATLQAARDTVTGGILHCFSGSWEMARQCLNLGYYIALGGPVTFANAHKVVDIARQVPLERLLLETDCPYLSPVPFRGKRNEPARVGIIAEKIAALRGISLAELAAATTQNACSVFGLTTEKP